MKFTISTIEEIPALINKLLPEIQQYKIVLINGKMGVGKTTFISALCKSLGSKDDVSSPTFSIVNEYLSNIGKVYHFDFYRINSLAEALDFGVEEYFYADALCLIEWPTIIAALLPKNTLSIDISVKDNHERTFEVYPTNGENIGFQPKI